MEKDNILFEDFIFSKWQTMSIANQRNGDRVYYKEFTKKGNKYFIAARFTQSGNYCYGYLTDENGTAIINGKGFDFTTFINHLEIGLKSI